MITYLMTFLAKLALGFLDKYWARKDLSDKIRLQIALRTQRQYVKAYEFLARCGDPSLKLFPDSRPDSLELTLPDDNAPD